MSAFDGIIDELNEQYLSIEQIMIKSFDEFTIPFNNYIKIINKAIEECLESGVAPKVNFENWESITDTNETNLLEKNITKENVNPNENVAKENTLKTRPRRNAFKEATQSINQQFKLSSNTRLKKSDLSLENCNNVIIKTEKKSMHSEPISELPKVVVKTENEDMPAPTRPAPRRKKQKKTEKIQVKQEKNEEPINNAQSESQDSDVILIGTKTITTIDLLDSDDDKTLEIVDEVNVKSTHKMNVKKKLGKRSRSSSPNEKNLENADKRPKSDTQPELNQNLTTYSNYEDAESNLEDNKGDNNATFITDVPLTKNLTSAPSVINNTTVVIENPTYIPTITDDLMTDDESEDDTIIKPHKSKIVSKSSKQIFSPFEPSPVKKKVQAFEKLREASAIPARITRTKGKAQTKQQEEVISKEVELTNTVKEKAKFFTPKVSKFNPPASSTTQKVNKVISSASSESLSVGKTSSSTKLSQAEFLEREKRRRGKEDEARKKRDALLQAQMEERKRKREEKQLKAQQQREALEKEKMKSLEIQKLKDEKYKQLKAEQEEKKQKAKEELEKKRLMAKIKAAEEKRKEEERRIEEQKKADEITAQLAKNDEEMARLVHKQKLQREKQKKIPVYLKTATPLLPTSDCFDSDDETYTSNSKNVLRWSEKKNLMQLELAMLCAGDATKNSFFSRQAQTPDLQEIFEVIDQNKLTRSSSGVWQKPPRFTMLSGLTEENDEYTSEDDNE